MSHAQNGLVQKGEMCMEIILRMLFLLLVATVNSVDNMGVRVAYSIGGIKVMLLKNLLISSMAFGVSFLSSYSGEVISRFLSEDLCSIFSMLLLILMGLRLIMEPYMKKKKGIEDGGKYVDNVVKTKALGYKEAALVGIGLALDDIGGSVSVGLVGYNPFMVGLAFFIVSYLIFLSGNYLIKYSDKLKIGNKATIISGIILIIIGIFQVLE